MKATLEFPMGTGMMDVIKITSTISVLSRVLATVTKTKTGTTIAELSTINAMQEKELRESLDDSYVLSTLQKKNVSVKFS